MELTQKQALSSAADCKYRAKLARETGQDALADILTRKAAEYTEYANTLEQEY